jgi:soluble lytic murein transglycosylase-like protein
MALLAAVAALVLPGGSGTACASSECEERVARHRCRLGSVTECIDRAAMRWHVSAGMLRRKAWCESRWRPGAVNPSSGAAGLFQFLWSTWATTPYARRSPFNAEYSSLAAGWMHAVGRGGEWACA